MGPVRDGSVILDLGCGTGNLCRDIIDRFPLCTVIAADRDPSMIELLRQNLADRLSGVPMPGRVFLLETEISGVFAQLGTLNLRPNYAFLVNVLYLLTDAECVLRETASCLADGGELRISNPSENSSVDQLLDRLKCDLVEAQEFPAMEGAFARVVRFNRDCLRPQLHRWSSAQIRSLLNAAGFSRIVYETHDHYGGQSILISAQK